MEILLTFFYLRFPSSFFFTIHLSSCNYFHNLCCCLSFSSSIFLRFFLHVGTIFPTHRLIDRYYSISSDSFSVQRLQVFFSEYKLYKAAVLLAERGITRLETFAAIFSASASASEETSEGKRQREETGAKSSGASGESEAAKEEGKDSDCVCLCHGAVVSPLHCFEVGTLFELRLAMSDAIERGSN